MALYVEFVSLTGSPSIYLCKAYRRSSEDAQLPGHEKWRAGRPDREGLFSNVVLHIILYLEWR
jgi:hypothetical protein